jgi:hypothetical protein
LIFLGYEPVLTDRERYVEASYRQRTRFESVAERKLRRRELARTAMPRLT